jgi:outer membrane protein OmpA-like peptidoglycan-associated protein
VVDLLREARPRTVRIDGHTDDKGSPGYNVRLSKRRAQAVERALGSALGGAKVTVVGRGEADPVASNRTKDGADSPKGRARNRRVEIRLPRAR